MGRRQNNSSLGQTGFTTFALSNVLEDNDLEYNLKQAAEDAAFRDHLLEAAFGR
jgi:hypothetical protein